MAKNRIPEFPKMSSYSFNNDHFQTMSHPDFESKLTEKRRLPGKSPTKTWRCIVYFEVSRVRDAANLTANDKASCLWYGSTQRSPDSS